MTLIRTFWKRINNLNGFFMNSNFKNRICRYVLGFFYPSPLFLPLFPPLSLPYLLPASFFLPSSPSSFLSLISKVWRSLIHKKMVYNQTNESESFLSFPLPLFISKGAWSQQVVIAEKWISTSPKIRKKWVRGILQGSPWSCAFTTFWTRYQSSPTKKSPLLLSSPHLIFLIFSPLFPPLPRFWYIFYSL